MSLEESVAIQVGDGGLVNCVRTYCECVVRVALGRKQIHERLELGVAEDMTRPIYFGDLDEGP